jgi:UDP-N-acetylmuramoyl-tripeptide--D-alanyl-D-alanine ligase
LPGLEDIVEALTGYQPDRSLITKRERMGGLTSFSDAAVDSRQAIRGSLFIAVPGEKLDGHDFVLDAFNRGAVLALIQRDVLPQLKVLDLRQPARPEQLDMVFESHPLCLRVENTVEALQKIAAFWRRKLNIKVIGITGSVGKSTSKELIAEVLSQKYHTLRNPGNLNNEIGLPLTLLQLTPRHERAVLEMGFYVAGEIKLLCDIALPQIGVITNIGTVHAERAGSREAIARGKAELVEALPPSPDGVAILNHDDPYVRNMADRTSARIFYYGLNPEADLWADNVEGMGLEGIRFRLHYGRETLHIRVPMIGRHSVHTVLRAVAVGLQDNLDWQEIVTALQSPVSQIRLVIVRSKHGALMLDDTYNASPESDLAALNLLNELSGHKIAVLGDMLELGFYERRGHAIVGLRAAEVVDELITVGERGKQIAMSAKAGGLPNDRIISFENSNQVVDYLSENLTSQDVVLVKGSRGMQMDRIVSALEDRK